jgi:hypothetical protein
MVEKSILKLYVTLPKIMYKFTNKNLYYREFLYQDNRCNTEFS